jgi:phosphate transport system ATP-binding protein
VTKPDLILFDEPTSALDPTSTAHIEELMRQLKSQVTILIVTHSLQQAARFSDYAAFMYLGELVEFQKTTKLFSEPQHQLTQSYLAGTVG